MDPVPVLLDDVAVKFVCCEEGGFPPGVTCTTDPSANACYSQPAEVLVELSFIDLANAITTDWDESLADSCGDEEES